MITTTNWEDWAVTDWREAAARQLDNQAERARTFQAYYDGEAAVPVLMDTEERRTFRRFLREARANWCELVVNAVAERMRVTGFRFAGADQEAWDIWQASQMDADAELTQTDALVCSRAPVLVQPDADNPTGVSITPESPLEATVLYEPGNRRRRLAGFKRFKDEWTGAVTEVLILPDVIVTWPPQQRQYQTEANPTGLVGMIEVVPQPRSWGDPRSELTPVLPIQDRIQTTLFNRLVASDYAAFRQIWATGVKLAREMIPPAEEGAEPTYRLRRPFDVGADRLLTNENPDGRFGVIPESTMAGYLSAVEQDVNQLAAISQTPPSYLLGRVVNISADAIKAGEAGLVAKIRRRTAHVGEDWEEVMRTALTIRGHPAAADVSAEVVWADFETRSEAQRADALTKMATIGVPRIVLWEKWGATPQEVDRWVELAAEEEAAAEAARQRQVQMLAGEQGTAPGVTVHKTGSLPGSPPQ
jgi:hypothetical protein